MRPPPPVTPADSRLPGAEARDAYGERLPRSVGLFASIMVLIGITIGSGIFRVPATVAQSLTEPGPFLLVWVVGGVMALAGALTLGELAALYPRSGGILAYLAEGFGPMPAFLFGWSQLVIIRASALGAIATIFAEYLGRFVALTPEQVHWVAAGVIGTIGLLNWVGVRRAALVNNVATGVKYLALIALVLFAFTAPTGSAAHFSPAWAGPISLSAFATALVPVMWAYDGWADLSFMSGEVRDPGRTMPRALIFGTLLIIAIYLLVNAAYLYLVPLAEMARPGSGLIAATAAERIPAFGGIGARLIAAVVMVSTFSSVNGTMMASPRIFFGMADRGLFFKGIARVSPRFQSPSTAILLASALGIIYVLFNDFQQLADKFVLGIFPFYVLAVLAVFAIRRRDPALARPYRVLGYPVVPVVFLLGAAGMIVNALLTKPADTAFTFGIILVGIPVFYLARHYGKITPA